VSHHFERALRTRSRRIVDIRVTDNSEIRHRISSLTLLPYGSRRSDGSQSTLPAATTAGNEDRGHRSRSSMSLYCSATQRRPRHRHRAKPPRAHTHAGSASSRSTNVITLRSETANMRPSCSALARTHRVRRKPVRESTPAARARAPCPCGPSLLRGSQMLMCLCFLRGACVR
jgi:hypothetical protein